MQADVEKQLPLEACGLVGGKDGRSEVVIPVANALASPVRFRMDPMEQLAALQQIEDQGWELLAIYHSHPSGPDSPSATDVAEAAYPEAVNIIWYRENGAWRCRGFLIDQDRVEEIRFYITNKE